MKQSRGSLAQKASLNGNVECLWYMLCALWRTTEICWRQLILAAVVNWDCHKSVVPWAHFPGIFRFEHYMKYSTYTMLYIFTFLALENYPSTLLLLFFFWKNKPYLKLMLSHEKRVKISFSSVSLALRSWYSLFNLILFSRLAVRIISN